jgi:hypothetical protein
MQVALAALGMAGCVLSCTVGMIVIGKIAARFRRGSVEQPR